MFTSKMYIKKIKENWGYILLFCLILFTHCYQLSDIPHGINTDEAGIYYDSWNLLHYGVNRQLDSWPLYLENYGGGMSILYAYLCIPLMAIWGPSLTIVRIPIVVFTMLTAIYGLRIIRMRKFDQKWLEYAFLFAIAVLPIFVVMFRFAIDCNLMLGASTVFLYYFLQALETGKKKFYVLAGLTGGIVLYTYILSHIVLPLFLLLTCIYLLMSRQFSWKNWSIMAIPLGLLSVPLIATHIISHFQLGKKVIGVFTLPQLWSYASRSDDLSLTDSFMSIPIVLKCMFWKDMHRFDTVERFSPMFILSIPFAFIGIAIAVMACRKYRKHQSSNIVTPIIFFWLISEFCMGCLQGLTGLTSYKLNAIYFALLFIVIEGINAILQRIKPFPRLKMFVTSFIIAFYCIRGGFFLHYYFTDYVEDTYPIWLFAGDMTEAINFIDSINSEDKDVYIGNIHQAQLYYTISKLPSPYEQTFPSKDYGNIHYYLPDKIDYTAIFLVRDVDTEYINNLRFLGFDEKTFGDYVVFYSDWQKYTLGNENINYTVDHFEQLAENSYIISGWSLNPNTGLPWDMILLKTENGYYSAIKTERKDVALVVGSDLVELCGYQLNIENLLSFSDATFVYVDNTNKERFETSFHLE